MTGPSVDIGRDLQFFADPQSAFKTIATDYPVATDAVRVLTASANGKSPFVMFADKRGTSTALGIINQKRTAEFSMECYAYVTNRGTLPDWADMMSSGGWTAVVSSGAEVTATGGSTTVITTASTSGYSVGDAALFETASGSDEYEIRRITNIVTNTNITVSPALVNSPASGAKIRAGILFKPKDAKDTTPDALTLWACNNNSQNRLIGAVVGSQNISMGGDEAARMTFSGTARQSNLIVQTTLNAGGTLGASTTSFDISDTAVIPSDVSAAKPVYFKVDDEVMKVTGVSGDTVTVATRQSYLGGGSNVSHTDGSMFTPYVATGSYAGTPIPATSGQLIVAGVVFQAGTVSIDIDQGIVYRENVHGDEYVVDGYVGGQRAVTATLDGWSFFSTTMAAALSARERTGQVVHAQQGMAEGGILAVEMPKFQFEQPDLDRSGDEVTVSMTGQARGTSAENEIFVMVG
jgi:hypothetical protein